MERLVSQFGQPVLVEAKPRFGQEAAWNYRSLKEGTIR